MTDRALLDRLETAFSGLRKPTPQELSAAWVSVAATAKEILPYAGDPGVYPYGRKKLFATDEVEILVMNWAPGRDCAPHDHGHSFGLIDVVMGAVRHTLYTLDQDDVPVAYLEREEAEGTSYFAARSMIHSMGNRDGHPTVTAHVYAPPIAGMKVYDLQRCAACIVSNDCGAWWPDEQRQRVKEIRLTRTTSHSPSYVTLDQLTDPGLSNPDVVRRLTTHPLDIDSFTTLDDTLDIDATAGRTVRRLTVESGSVLAASAADSRFLVLGGRVEIVPLSSSRPAELLGEGQTFEVTAGEVVGLRPSAHSPSADIVEVALGGPLSTLCADRVQELDRIPQLRDYYYGYADRYAAVYQAGAPYWEPPEPNEILRHALQELGIGPCVVIDLGCGEGRDTIHLASEGFEAYGVDVARPALGKARERARRLGLDVRFLERDITTLRNLPRAGFDLALNMGCLHMIPDADLRSAHLSRVFQLLRPGATFVLAHCREKWLEGFFSVPAYEAAGPVVPGRVIDRRIRLAGGGTTTIPLPIVPYKQSSDAELAAELKAHGFEVVADLSGHSNAFGNTVVLAARRPGL
jgi:cysteine dioxygenase